MPRKQLPRPCQRLRRHAKSSTCPLWPPPGGLRGHRRRWMCDMPCVVCCVAGTVVAVCAVSVAKQLTPTFPSLFRLGSHAGSGYGLCACRVPRGRAVYGYAVARHCVGHCGGVTRWLGWQCCGDGHMVDSVRDDDDAACCERFRVVALPLATRRHASVARGGEQAGAGPALVALPLAAAAVVAARASAALAGSRRRTTLAMTGRASR